MNELKSLLSEWFDPREVGSFLLGWGGRAVAALAIFLIGRIIARALAKWLSRAMRRVGPDETLSRFFGNLVYTGLLVFVILTAITALGVPTTNFLAILGAAGLAIGLALKDSLSNFSSGVMLVLFRPFKVGDQIEAANTGGVVDAIGIFNVTLKTPDNRVITVPNSLVYSGTITNYNAEPRRRIDLLVQIGYDADIPQAKAVITAITAAEARIAREPAPEVAVQDVLPASVTLVVRAWVATPDYGAVRSDLLERIKRSLDKYELSVPPEHRVLPVTIQTASK
ncbi:MAG TPA: mechanosensitive ion channel domain-containing protein [Gammaproteobacteria bacterium]|jgi:small conductance mechanosensitive channel|nr:mechanosensitive ion channel domain-containing protein [Gammaproteobacteria bacterium]